MQKILLIFLIPVSAYLLRCSKASKYEKVSKRDFETNTSTPFHIPDNEALIEIQTEFGNIKCRLYNETPLHRDNFLKLAEGKYFDSLLFHRVIKNFVIQGGDPDSKKATKEKVLGDGGPGYNIPAELLPAKYFHKKGSLAAARESDDINPKKESSGSQFYIVQGKIQDDASLIMNEKRINRPLLQKITDSLLNLPENARIKSGWMKAREEKGNKDSLIFFKKIIDSISEPHFKNRIKYEIPQNQRYVYKKIGGTPHLDSHYTVFGEVYEGLDVLDKIIIQETDKNDRPLTDVRMRVRIIRRNK
ncbi:MAG: peptidylprolyl isomerase [Bacteroidota bacterium]|jgi:peptidylprolyl isomerase